MPIFNASVTGEGGGQGGGDKVTALVGSNASGVDVGDKVILNTDLTKSLASEYRFDDQASDSGQWAIFFGEYMMYVDVSGHPILLKHDIVEDVLVPLRSFTDITLPVFKTNQGDSYDLKVTYNESTKRFATCAAGSLNIYQVDLENNNQSISQIGSVSCVSSFGGISQDSDTLWYMTTSGDFDSIVVKDFSYENGEFSTGEAYTHTNTCPSFSSTSYYVVAFSPNLSYFVFTKGDTTAYLAGAAVNKNQNTITYSSSLSGQLSTASTFISYYIPFLNKDGVGVILAPPRNSSMLCKVVFSISSDASISLLSNTGAQEDISSEVGSYFTPNYYGSRCGIVHQTGDWVTGYLFALNITTDGFIRTHVSTASRQSSGGGCCYVTSLSSTGLFMWPYRAYANPLPYSQILTRWNNGSPTRGDSYITPDASLTYPLYFDGDYLYAVSGVFSRTSGALEKIGSFSTSGMTYNKEWAAPILLDGRVCFGVGGGGQGTSIAFFKDGLVSGNLSQEGISAESRQLYALDARLDSTNTGLVTFVRYNENYYSSGAQEIAYYVGGGKTANCPSGYGTAGFFGADGVCYRVSTTALSSCVVNNNAIEQTSLFSTSIMSAMLGALDRYSTNWLCIQGDKVDNYQIWYKAGNRIYGITKLDLFNSQMIQVTTPTALQEISGTIYACWWDLQNRLNVRTSTGLYVFSYSNHDISTLQLVKKFGWTTDYSGPATCSPDLKSYAVGNTSYIKVVTQTPMPIYEFSANVYNGHNFAGTSLTGFVNEAPTTDPYGQSIVEVNTVKDPADPWTNVGTPFGFPVSTASANVSVGAGYYNSGSAEIIMPSTVTKTLSQASSGQTTGFKNDIVVYHDTSDNSSALVCKTGTTPAGTFKASTALSTNVYLNDDKSVITGTNADSGFDVSYDTEAPESTYYTVAGSPTISSAGILSGLTTSDYVTLDTYYLVSPSTFEFNTALSITSAPVEDQTYLIISGNTTDSHYYAMSGIQLNIKNNQLAMGLYYGPTNVITYGIRGSTVLSLNTKYYIRIVFDGTKYTLQISTDGINYTDEVSYTSSTRVYQTAGLLIGGARSYNYPLNGEIYLADTNLTVEGSLVWKAFTPATDGSVTISDGYKYLDEVDPPFYLSADLTRSASQMVVHSEDFVETSTDIADYTIVGSPTITEKILSNCSSSNYASGPSVTTDTDFEIFTKIKQPSARTAKTGILRFGGVYIFISVYNKFAINSTSGSSWGSEAAGSDVPVNQWVWLKYTKSGSTLTLYSSSDGETWTQQCTQSSSYYATQEINMLGQDGSPALEMDLSETYMTRSGSVFWSAYKSVTAKQGTLLLAKPTATSTSSVIVANTAAVPATANYTIVGSGVTVDSNHVASGFTTSSYLKIPFGYDPATNSPSFEMVIHIKTPADVSNQEGIGLQVIDGVANQWWLKFGINSNWLFLGINNNAATGTAYTLSGNTEYYIKIAVSSGTTVSISTDGTNYTNVISLSGARFSAASGVVDYFYLGYNMAHSPFTGSIYLDDCYIKFNGSTVWVPYTQAQPSEPIDTSKEYCGSVVDPINKGKVVTMDTALAKILSVEDSA